MSRSGGPLPPCTATMRAPPVLISLRVKPSNIAWRPCSALIAERAAEKLFQLLARLRQSLHRDTRGFRQRHGDGSLASDTRVEIVGAHHHLFDAELAELLLDGWIAE